MGGVGRRQRALAKLQDLEVLMRDGHFDYGNGFHGRVYLNPHQLFRHPSTIWRLAQDLLDVLPADLLARTDVVAGPATGGALLAHTMAGLLDGRRALTHPPCSFAPITYDQNEFRLWWTKYAMGWLISEGKPWAGGPALTHAGSNTMWYAVAWLAPAKDFAVVVTCNQANDKACDDAVLALIADHFKGDGR